MFFKINKLLTVFSLITALIIAGSDFELRAQNKSPEKNAFSRINSNNIKAKNSRSIREKIVGISSDIVDKNSINLNLFDDINYKAVRKHIKRHRKHGITWTGNLKNIENSSVNITVYKDHISGTINLPGKTYEINSSGSNISTIEEIDIKSLPVEALPLSPDQDPNFIQNKLFSDSLSQTALSNQNQTGEVIDLLVVYTPALTSRFGPTGMETKIINAVEMINDSYQRSGIPASVNLVHFQEVNYFENGNMPDSLNAITDPNDGNIDIIHSLRNQYGADIVSFLTDDGGWCGYSWVMTSNFINSFEPYAFNVTDVDCISNHSLTHEIAHNQGSDHDRNNANTGAYQYSYGYRNPGQSFRTIMAYSCNDIGGSCPRVPHFSNPFVDYNNSPTGINHDSSPSDSADNVRSISNNLQIISNWRPSVNSYSLPDSPSNLTSLAVSTDTITLSWFDNSDNEDGFYIERSVDNNNWLRIATINSNTTTFSDNTLDPSTTYYYSIQAFNSVGNSSFSNTTNSITYDIETPSGQYPFQEVNGQVVMEAENFDENNPGNTDDWFLSTSQGGFSGTGYMESGVNNSNVINTGYSGGNSPELKYLVNFTNTGTYFVWTRACGPGTSDDSIHMGIDGNESSTANRKKTLRPCNTFRWSRSRMSNAPNARITVSSAGLHEINLWMREDGSRVDKILLTTSNGFTPTGTGPAESTRDGDPPPPPAVFTLNVQTNGGTGTGDVTSNPGGIDCGGDCSGDYDEDTVVTLTATPDSGSEFINWSGDCAGTNVITNVTITSNKTCTANFNLETPPGGTGAYIETGGQVVMEAENFDENNPGNTDDWFLSTSQGGFSGTGYMESGVNNSNVINTGYSGGNSPELKYLVNFTNTGTYFVWTRACGPGTSDDSIHMGIDGNESSTANRKKTLRPCNTFRWSRSRMSNAPNARITVSSAGLHEINLWMREDGSRVDKILLTTSSGFTPTGTGPAESVRE